MVEFADDTGLTTGEGSRSKVRWDSSSRKNRLTTVRKYGAHCSLFLALVVYTAVGALVFRHLEMDHEIATIKSRRQKLVDGRTECIERILTADSVDMNVRRVVTIGAILDYEKVIGDVLNQKFISDNETEIDSHWDYVHSAFFASTVLTTIGYGNSAPATYMGRVFCILFALIGIPLTLSVIADLGKMMASMLSASFKRFKKQMPRGEMTTCARLAKKFGKSATVGAAIGFLLFYIAAGAALYMYIENWSFFQSFYFCFITMTTIGFGDFVPGNKQWLLICTLYILIGLAITSTSIELVRSQYADSWRKMRELSTRLQGLSGPLAETLKNYGKNVNLDVSVLQDLKDLKKALAMSSGRTREGSIFSKKFWENEDGYEDQDENSSEPRLIQIIIYESSV